MSDENKDAVHKDIYKQLTDNTRSMLKHRYAPVDIRGFLIIEFLLDLQRSPSARITCKSRQNKLPFDKLSVNRIV